MNANFIVTDAVNKLKIKREDKLIVLTDSALTEILSSAILKSLEDLILPPQFIHTENNAVKYVLVEQELKSLVESLRSYCTEDQVELFTICGVLDKQL